MDCTFDSNQAESAGGSLYALNTVVTLTRCTFMNSHSATDGGAAYLDSCDTEIDACTFADNVAHAPTPTIGTKKD